MLGGENFGIAVLFDTVIHVADDALDLDLVVAGCGGDGTTGRATKTLHGGDDLGFSVVFVVEIVQVAAGAFDFCLDGGDLVMVTGDLVMVTGDTLETQQNDSGFVTSAILCAAFVAADCFGFVGFAGVAVAVVTGADVDLGAWQGGDDFGASTFLIGVQAGGAVDFVIFDVGVTVVVVVVVEEIVRVVDEATDVKHGGDIFGIFTAGEVDVTADALTFCDFTMMGAVEVIVTLGTDVEALCVGETFGISIAFAAGIAPAVFDFDGFMNGARGGGAEKKLAGGVDALILVGIVGVAGGVIFLTFGGINGGRMDETVDVAMEKRRRGDFLIFVSFSGATVAVLIVIGGVAIACVVACAIEISQCGVLGLFNGFGAASVGAAVILRGGEDLDDFLLTLLWPRSVCASFTQISASIGTDSADFRIRILIGFTVATSSVFDALFAAFFTSFDRRFTFVALDRRFWRFFFFSGFGFRRAMAAATAAARFARLSVECLW